MAHALVRFPISRGRVLRRGHLVGDGARRPDLRALGLGAARDGPDDEQRRCPSCSASATRDTNRIVFYLVIGVVFAVTLPFVVRACALARGVVRAGLLTGVAGLRDQVADLTADRDTAQAQTAAAVVGRGDRAAPARARHPRRPAAAAGPARDGPRPGQAAARRSDPERGRARPSTRRSPRPARRSTSCARSRAASRRRSSPTAASPPRSPPRRPGHRPGRAGHRRARRGWPPLAEQTAYFTVAEALTNVAKHSGATRRRSSVGPRRRALEVTVTDDGLGGAHLAKGHGLAGLADRLHGRRRHALGAAARRAARPCDPRGAPAGGPHEDRPRRRRGPAAGGPAAAAHRGGPRRRGGRSATGRRWSPPMLAHRPDVVHRGRTDAAVAHRRGAAGGGRRPRGPGPARRCWCCRSTSRSPTPTTCSPTGAAAVGYLLKDRVADIADFLGRAGAGSPPAAPCSTPRWWRSCWSDAGPATRSTADAARARGADADGRGPLQHRDRPRARGQRGRVEKHVRNIFAKLDLPPDEDSNRRVLAVLAFLRS